MRKLASSSRSVQLTTGIMIFSCLVWIIGGCTSFYSLSPEEASLMHLAPGEPADLETIVTTSDGWSYRFEAGDVSIVLDDDGKSVSGTVSMETSDSKHMGIPLAAVTTIQVNESILVYTKDARVFEFEPLSWFLFVSNSAVDSIGGIGEVTYLEDGRSEQVQGYVPLDEVESMELNGVNTVATLAVVVGGVVLGGAVVLAVVLGNSSFSGMNMGGF